MMILFRFYALFAFLFRLFFLYILINYVCCDSLKGNCFVHKSKVVGVNFPTSSPVIQNKTLGWEPSTEKMTARDGVLMGDVPMFLKLEEGGTLKCHLTTTYKYVAIVGSKISLLY